MHHEEVNVAICGTHPPPRLPKKPLIITNDFKLGLDLGNIRYGRASGEEIGGRGVSPTGKSFRVVPCRAVRACGRACVRACAQSGCLVELDRKRGCLAFPFSLHGAPSFPFSLLGATGFPFSLPPPPKPPIQRLIGMLSGSSYNESTNPFTVAETHFTS